MFIVSINGLLLFRRTIQQVDVPVSLHVAAACFNIVNEVFSEGFNEVEDFSMFFISSHAYFEGSIPYVVHPPTPSAIDNRLGL